MSCKRVFLFLLGSPLPVVFPILTTSSFISGKICHVISVETRELPRFGFLGYPSLMGTAGTQSWVRLPQSCSLLGHWDAVGVKPGSPRAECIDACIPHAPS